jgi:hypothetical protein
MKIEQNEDRSTIELERTKDEVALVFSWDEEEKGKVKATSISWGLGNRRLEKEFTPGLIAASIMTSLLQTVEGQFLLLALVTRFVDTFNEATDMVNAKNN